MNDVLADTHAIIWALSDLPRLSKRAATALTVAQQTGRTLVATITLVELTYLVEKRRIDPAVLAKLWNVLLDPAQPIDALPLSLEVARVLGQIPRVIVPDMPDRIISATALAHGLPLISADNRIRSLAVPGLGVIW